MPYSGASDPNLPDNIKSLPAKKRRQFVHVFNSAMAKHGKESTAFAMANSVIKGGNSDDYVGGYELDEHRLTQDQAEYVPLSTTSGQACANCQWFVNPSACCIVFGPISPTGWCSHWEAEVPDEVITITPGQPVTFTLSDIPEHGLIVADNAEVWTTAFVNDLPDSSFAYIEPGGSKDSSGKTTPRSKRHFPIKNASGKPDAAHVRNALARASQSPFGSKALPKIKSAAATLNIKIGTSESPIDSLKSHFNGLLERAHVSLGGKPEVPSFTTWDTPNGTKFMAWWSNCFKDKSGKIIPIGAQKEYIKWCDDTESYPPVVLWHTAEQFAQVEMLDFVDGFNIAFGSILPGKEDTAYRLANWEGGVGCSHGSLYEETDTGEILRFRPFEITALPAQRARNSWTNFLTGANWEEEMAFTDEKKAFLKGAGGLTDEQIVASEAATEAMAKALKANKIEWADDSPPDLIGVQGAITSLADSVASLATSVAGIVTAQEAAQAELNTIKAAQAEASKSLDDKVTQELTPRATPANAFVASNADTNVQPDGTANKNKEAVFSVYEQLKKHSVVG